MFYEQLKSRATLHYHPDGSESPIPFSATVATSAAAGAAASYISSPLDLAKLRMQITRAGGSAGEAGYGTFVGALRTIWEREGVRGLFRGSVARVVFFCPATAVTMGVYEYMKNGLRDERNDGGGRAESL